MISIFGETDITSYQTFVKEATSSLSGEDGKKFVRAAMLSFLARVIPRTPVDTGRVRAGWTASRAKEGYGVVKMKTLSGSYYAEIFNGVPYVVWLELGSSRQAPSGFVRLTLREMTDDLNEEARRSVEAQLRLANIKARKQIGLKQGIGRRPKRGRLNILRR